MLEAHGGAFKGLIGLDKQINGLSDIQKQILEGMYAGDDNKAKMCIRDRDYVAEKTIQAAERFRRLGRR